MNLDERKTLIASLLRKYQPEIEKRGGRIPWRHIFKSEPEAAVLLDASDYPARNKIAALARYMRLGMDGLAASRPKGREKLALKLKAWHRRNEQDRALLRRILRQYRADQFGRTDWQRVFKDHPEWARRLRATDRRGLERVWAMASLIKRREPAYIPPTKTRRAIWRQIQALFQAD